VLGPDCFRWARSTTVAFTDPCEAPLPRRAGEDFAGVVRYVGDGDGLCVGASSDPLTWIAVRLAAPELNAPGDRAEKAALERIAMDRAAECVARERATRPRST
jgi:hypothetical protein